MRKTSCSTAQKDRSTPFIHLHPIPTVVGTLMRFPSGPRHVATTLVRPTLLVVKTIHEYRFDPNIAGVVLL